MTRIVHLSDPHFGAVDPRAAAAFLTTVRELAPDLTLLSGDLTMRARRSELAAAREFVEALPEPRMVIPGNHDMPMFNHPAERVLDPFGRFRDTFGEELEPERVSHGVHVVALNSSRAFGWHADWSEGRLSKSQLGSLVRRFAAAVPGHLRVLMLHHPLLELQVRGRAVVKPLEALMAAIEEARVDLVLCGHFHRSQLHAAGVTDSWRAVISQAPTVCSTRLQGEPQGFHEFHWGDDHLEAIHHVYEAGEFHAGPSALFSRTAAGWIRI